LSWLKCPQCRTRKLKVGLICRVIGSAHNLLQCEFLEGPWPIKCRQCNLHGLQCSEPRETERRAAKGKLNSTDGSLSDSISSTGSHTSRTPHAEQIPSPGISSQNINDAALLLQLQEPPPATYMPLWPLDYDFDRNTFQSQPAGFPSLSTLSVSMSSPPNYVYPPVK
jgi:hypothetical protein